MLTNVEFNKHLRASFLTEVHYRPTGAARNSPQMYAPCQHCDMLAVEITTDSWAQSDKCSSEMQHVVCRQKGHVSSAPVQSWQMPRTAGARFHLSFGSLPQVPCGPWACTHTDSSILEEYQNGSQVMQEEPAANAISRFRAPHQLHRLHPHA